MKLWSNSFGNGERIPAKYAAGKPDAQSTVTLSDNVNPHLAWSDAPTGTKSFVLICHDFDVPSRADDVNKADREIPSDLPRVDFFHWVLIDIAPTRTELREGEHSKGFTARGKPASQVRDGARHGINDYTNWFAGDAQMSGDYHGYDGPFPPFNDTLVHHYVFTLYALDIDRVPVEGRFSGADVRKAIAGHVLAEATHSGTYTLNKRLG